MKQSKKLPRRVAGSLMYSLNHMANKISNAIQYTESRHTMLPEAFLAVNSKYLNAKDKEIVSNITDFWNSLSTMSQRSKGITEDAFLTIADHSEMRVRYVAENSSTGLVITTKCIERLLELSVNVVDSVTDASSKNPKPSYVCEDNYRYGRADACSPPHFLRVLDVLRYMDETECKVLEISMKDIAKDIKVYSAFNGYVNGYGYSNSVSTPAIKKMYPSISDRYQHENWKHYLTTLYKGMLAEVNEKFAPATPIVRDVALMELNLR